MKQGNSLEVPQPTDDLQHWEAYFRGVVEAESVCRVRTSHLQQTPQEREQIYLKHLAGNATILLNRNALSHHGHFLQRQILELIKLRRRYVPDHSIAQNHAAVFLAIVQLHRAIQILLERIDQMQQLHSVVELQIRDLHKAINSLCLGKITEADALSSLIQRIRNTAADSTVKTEEFLGLCFRSVTYDLQGLQNVHRYALANAMQTGFLAARIFRNQTANQNHPLGHSPVVRRFGIESQSFLVACLLKDAGIWLQNKTAKTSAQLHHAELSASLVSGLTGLQVGTLQVIRQHHECFDGSGLPLGVRKSGLHIESRLLGVMTRWTELFNQSLDQLNHSAPLTEDSSATGLASNLLTKELLQNRWDKPSTLLLFDTLGIRKTQIATKTAPLAQSKTAASWKIPRPHFLDSLSTAKPVAVTHNRVHSPDY